VVIPPLHDTYFARLLHFLILKLKEFGYDVMIRTVTDKSKKKESIFELLDQRVRGVLVLGAGNPEVCSEVQDILGSSIPLVIVGATVDGVSCVSTNKFNGALQAGRHLASIGRKRLAVMVGHSISITGSDNKIAGFSQASLEANLPAPICLGPTLSQSTDETLAIGYQQGNVLLDNHRDVDGVLCASDGYAISMICACLERGIRVPEDIAIVGFDDTPEARYSAIPLTTVQQPIQELARIAANMLFSEINSFPSFVPETTILDCKLIVRQSTNPLWKPEQVST
jgi:DNA-binding LacI/PurR family transcriptional regulator